MLNVADPKNDYAFKAVFGSPQHERVLVHLLNAVLVPLGLRVRHATVLNPLSDFQSLNDKKLILDVKAIDDARRLYNVEMQMVPSRSFPGRFLYYWSNLYGSQLKEGEHYERLRPVISLCFLDGVLFPERPEPHLRFRLLETTAHFPFTDDLDLHLFQLSCFQKSPDELADDLDLWLYVLNNGRNLDVGALPPPLRVPEVQEALEVWRVLTQEQIQREIYEARERARRDADDWKIAVVRAEERARRSEEHARQVEERARRSEEFVRYSRDQGRAEGRAEGWIAQIRLCEELLRCPPRPEAELSAMPPDALQAFAESLRAQLSQGR